MHLLLQFCDECTAVTKVHPYLEKIKIFRNAHTYKNSCRYYLHTTESSCKINNYPSDNCKFARMGQKLNFISEVKWANADGHSISHSMSSNWAVFVLPQTFYNK